MKYRTLILFAAILFSLSAASARQIGAQEAVNLIKAGDPFPEIALTRPATEADSAYLGLGGGDHYTLSQVKADLVIVEILSVYCASCRRQVPLYNRLHELIENDPRTAGRIKILGVAAGNGKREVEKFRENMELLHPVAPDPRFEMHRAIGGSRTPFSIYVRQDRLGQPGIVAGTHLGINRQIPELLEKLVSLMPKAPASLRKAAEGTPGETVTLTPILSETAIEEIVKAAFSGIEGPVSEFSIVPLKSARKVFTGLTATGQRIFAEATSRPSACDVCHDVHFIYLFDAQGTVLRFIPLQLTKEDNWNFDREDVRWMQARIIGRSILKPLPFDPEVDAVSSATITSSLVYDSLSRGAALFRELAEKGLL